MTDKGIMDKFQGITALSGGVGGAKLVEGFALMEPPAELAIIGNVGDDVEQHGLWVSPDMDIVTYTLAGIVNKSEGWGIAGDTFHSLNMLSRLEEETWMNLGDRDIAVHVYRTRRRKEGARPTIIAQHIRERLGVKYPILPPTDDFLQTMVETDAGSMNFQEYYLKRLCEPEPLNIWFKGAESAQATPEAAQALLSSSIIAIAPSNPVASIGPILAVNGVRSAMIKSRAFRVAVSPIVGGHSLKGPSARMLRSQGYTADPIGIAHYYEGLIDAMVIDEADRKYTEALENMGLKVRVTRTVMRNSEDRIHLAREIVEMGRSNAL